jgi:hypothetical protein
MANILTIASLLLVAVTVVTNGWQAREVARQTGILANTNRALLAHQVEAKATRLHSSFCSTPTYIDILRTIQPHPKKNPSEDKFAWLQS